MRRLTRLFAAPLLLAPAWSPWPLAAQLPEHPALAEAFLAWDRGDYPEALAGYLEALRGPDGAALVEDVALLTGELYRVTEVTTDGSGVRVGPTGRYATYQAEEDGRAVTRVIDVEADGRLVATLPGEDAVLTGGGSVAYVHVRPSPELEAARRLAADLRRGEDRQAYLAALERADALEAAATEVRLRALPGTSERTLDLEARIPESIVAAHDADRLYFVVASEPGAPATAVLEWSDGSLREVPAGDRPVGDVLVAAGGRHLVLTPGRGGGRGGRGSGGGELVVVDLATGAASRHAGASPALSADGSALAWVATTEDGDNAVRFLRLGGTEPATVVRTSWDVANPALSPDGDRVVYQARPVHDWEVFLAPTAEEGEPVQLSKEIQHDLYPRFLDATTVLAAKGEGRHRRSFLYDTGTGEVTKLFHNNTVRTIAPEYEWEATPDGRKVLIVSERDGDTVSPERGLYIVHLDRKVDRAGVERRLQDNLAAERLLRERGAKAFMPIGDEVRRVTERVDVGRIYQYAKVLYEMDSKYITEPGNRMAVEYLEARLREFGYEPELQWFEPRPGVRTANVIARLPGTTDPGLVYVASSHFDSTQRGPGADDDSSGTTALLEAARVMKGHPRRATIEFAFFTGEEAGLLGSREYVRRAVAEGKRIVGALNNDMIGWANDHRLDNTIRYSNPGIRDIQHAAAILFSDLITYDALYYKSTDAAAYYEAYGDIVGGIGSYPVLGNPHYHQFTDRLETIDQRLVAEVSRVTAATLMLLAASPARLTDVEVVRSTGSGSGRTVELAWDAAPESDVVAYRVTWTDAAGALASADVPAPAAAPRPSARLEGVRPGSTVSVKAVNRAGLEGWDWAHVTLGR